MSEVDGNLLFPSNAHRPRVPILPVLCANPEGSRRVGIRSVGRTLLSAASDFALNQELFGEWFGSNSRAGQAGIEMLRPFGSLVTPCD